MTPIEALFSSYRSKNVHVLLNQGNRGDGLIHYSGRLLMEKYDLLIKEIRYPQKASGKTLFVYGSGAFNNTYHHMVKFVKYYQNNFEEIIILPATFDPSCNQVKKFLQSMDNKIIIFCREKESYSLVKKYVSKNIKIYLDQDLALYLNLDNKTSKGKGTLCAFRKDPEMPIIKIAPSYKNIDISLGTDIQETMLIDIISNYSTIHTNRIHVAIASALLNKKTFLYANNYHKSESIYKHSLHKFKNVTWRQLPPQKEISHMAKLKNKLLVFLYNNITKSYFISTIKLKTIYAA